MAPPVQYERPNEQLVRLLSDAKRRGLTFGEAWEEALRPGRSIVMSNTAAAPATAVRWPTDRMDRDAWRSAILRSREGWRRAFYDEPPTRGEEALRFLGEAFATLDRVSGELATREGIPAVAAVASAA